MRLILLAVVALAAHFAHAQPSIAVTPEADQKLDYAEMREYVIARLTDDQIREAHRLAGLDHEKHLKDLARSEAEAAVRTRQRFAKCGDIAYKTRNPGACTLGHYIPREPTTREQFFELRLMKGCLFVNSKQKAREFGCLPPLVGHAPLNQSFPSVTPPAPRLASSSDRRNDDTSDSEPYSDYVRPATSRTTRTSFVIGAALPQLVGVGDGVGSWEPMGVS